jgi:hypothetical protein
MASMISDDERQDGWTFLYHRSVSVKARVTVIDYPGHPERSTFVAGVTADGRLVYFENERYVCDDGTELKLPCV